MVYSDATIIHGRIDHITYKNQQTGYTVFTLMVDGEDVTAVGSFPFLSVGDVVTLSGEYIVHPTYGPQFRADGCEKETPTTEAAILRYLSSGAVKGIGPATAKKIVKRFGNQALEIIKDFPEQLCGLKGISLEKAKDISAQYRKLSGIQELMLFMSRFNASPEHATRIYKVLGPHSVDKIKENPYVLCCEEIGFGFQRVDEISESLEISPVDENRLFAGVEFVLRHNLLNGHSCLPRKKLVSVASELLACDADYCDNAVDKLLYGLRLRYKTIDDTDFVFLPAYYTAEEYIASRLFMFLQFSKAEFLHDLEIDHIENKLHIKYDEKQREAIKTAFEKGVLVLTGGPGTGKTTTLNGLIEIFERKGLDVILAAPTGRAAKRMSQLAGRDAKTIHRLLEVQWGDAEKQYFDRNERNPLICDVIIIDEMSMVDSLLFESLLRALRVGTKIIMVGDSNQLPSVSAGNVLHDIIASGVIPSVALEKIFRQADSSLIVHNAHEIINGRIPVMTSKESDFFMINCSSPASALLKVKQLCEERLPRAYGFSVFENIQVLCPSRKLELGTVNLNAVLQQSINPGTASAKCIRFGGFEYRENDKVMQIKNNYDIMWEKDDGEHGIGVYNGDIGVIERVDVYSQLITVRFDDRVATYYSGDFLQLEPAYAVTVHKSQGSEFDCVILPLVNIPSQLLYRNLLYTAVTRAKRLLIIVGDCSTLSRMIENDRKTLRYSGLKTMLEETAYGH